MKSRLVLVDCFESFYFVYIFNLDNKGHCLPYGVP